MIIQSINENFGKEEKIKNAIILTLNNGDSLFLKKDPGICSQKILHGALSDKIVVWIDEDKLETEEIIVGYVFPANLKDEDSYNSPYIIQREYYTLNTTFMSDMESNVFNQYKFHYEYILNDLKKRSHQWEHYIFVSKEERK